MRKNCTSSNPSQAPPDDNSCRQFIGRNVWKAASPPRQLRIIQPALRLPHVIASAKLQEEDEYIQGCSSHVVGWPNQLPLDTEGSTEGSEWKAQRTGGKSASRARVTTSLVQFGSIRTGRQGSRDHVRTLPYAALDLPLPQCFRSSHLGM